MSAFIWLNRHFRGPAKTTMHKRKDISGMDAIRGEISVTIVPCRFNVETEISLQANCWLKDKDGREQYLQLSHDTLYAIAQAVNAFNVEMTQTGEQMKPGTIIAERQ